MSKVTVLNTSNHPVDLDDGREIGPGEWAQDVDDGHLHNARLFEDGAIRVIPGVPENTPRPTEDPAPGASVAVASPAPATSSAPQPGSEE